MVTAVLGGVASCSSPAFEIPDTDGERAALCSNQERDGGETDVDCGGVCKPCANGKICEVNGDCLDRSCIEGMCQPESCTDGKKSPGETGMDCGGPDCAKCPPGGGCGADLDCTSGICTDDVCVEPSCGDDKKNGDETDVDCGGEDCEGCAVGEDCDVDGDCVSGDCRDGSCAQACAAGSGDCDGDDVCETNTTLDVDHCGSCDQACELPHAMPQCVGGVCEILSCEAPWEDCDGDAENGCEVNLDEDPKNCGACFSACVDVNGSPTCDAGSCGIDCEDGFDDCDGRLENGCEKDLTRDVANCGSCGNECEPENEDETVYCDADGCGSTVCDPGMGDCDGDGECETDLSESTDNCGACGNICVAAHGTTSCDAGECAIDKCADGFDDCNGDYADGCEAELAVDALNCGACDTECGSDCDRETGSCDVDHGTGWCSEGTCQIKSCDSDYRNCNGSLDDGCEVDFTSDTSNCGGCAASGGQDCSSIFAHADAHCVGGACEFDGCQGTWRDCEGGLADGCESNLDTDAQDCGACDTVCGTTNASSTSCMDGSCDPVCTGSWQVCANSNNGCTTDPDNDEDNCGACGDACSGAGGGTASCTNGQCSVSCGANFKNCNNENNARDGCETDVRSSITNCGGCNASCSSAGGGTASCASGQCSVSCGANFKNCNNENNARDGCETDVRSDPKNCGACNTNCVFCQSGTCLQHLNISVVKTSGKQENAASTGCGQTQLTLSHALTAQTSALEYRHRLLVLGVGFQANDVNAIPCQVSYGGQNFDQITDLGPNSGVFGYVYIMNEQKIRAANGSTLTVRINEHPSYGIIAAQLLEVIGVDQTNPLNDTYQTTSSGFALNPSSGGGLSVGDQGSLVYSFIARRDTEPTASFRNFYEAIGNARVGAGYFTANANDPPSTINWGGDGYAHHLSAISLQRAVTTCETGC